MIGSSQKGRRSHNTDLVGNIKGVLVLGEGDVGLLLSSWSVEGVNLLDLELVQLLARLLDHSLVGSFVNDKYKSVVVFNGLDCGLTGEWVLDNCELVEGVQVLHGLHSDLGHSLLHLCRGSSELHSGPDLCSSGGVGSLSHSLGGLASGGLTGGGGFLRNVFVESQ